MMTQKSLSSECVVPEVQETVEVETMFPIQWGHLLLSCVDTKNEPLPLSCMILFTGDMIQCDRSGITCFKDEEAQEVLDNWKVMQQMLEQMK